MVRPPTAPTAPPTAAPSAAPCPPAAAAPIAAQLPADEAATDRPLDGIIWIGASVAVPKLGQHNDDVLAEREII